MTILRRWITYDADIDPSYELYYELPTDNTVRASVEQRDNKERVWTRLVDTGNGFVIYNRKSLEENKFNRIHLGYDEYQRLRYCVAMIDHMCKATEKMDPAFELKPIPVSDEVDIK
jgi:hypothetical protein